MFSTTTINHLHRQEVGLSMEEYVIAKETFDLRLVHPMDRIDLISAKCGYSQIRVIMVLSRLSSSKIMHDGDDGLEVSDKWSSQYNTYYSVVK